MLQDCKGRSFSIEIQKEAESYRNEEKREENEDP